MIVKKVLTLAACVLSIGYIFFAMGTNAFEIKEGYGLKAVAEKADYSTDENANIYTTINLVVKVVLGILAIAFFGLITYSGIRWMTAQGNEEHVSKAKETIQAAVIGLIIVTVAYAITNFVFDTLDKEVDKIETVPVEEGEET